MSTMASPAASEQRSTDPDVEGEEHDLLSQDDIFHVLQNQRRRWVLKYLQGQDGPVRMRDIAEQVAAWEHETTVQRLDSTQRQRVYIPLYQNHLPKLDELNIIDYNQSRGVVERTKLADQLHPYLEPFERDEDTDAEAEAFPWELPYLGVAVVGTLLVVGKAAGVGMLAGVPDFFLGVLLLIMFSATSVAQFVDERVVNR